MTDEMNAMIELAREQIEMAAAKRDRTVLVSLTAGDITISVDPWLKSDCEGN